MIEYVKNRRPKIGIYAGSFNPFHTGHYNVLEQAEQIFDKVVIAQGINPDKKHSEVRPFPIQIQNRELVRYSGFLSKYLKEYEATGCEITLVRGLRNEYDLNYEQNLVQYIKDQMPSLKVVFFLCDRKFSHVSSGAIRALEGFDTDSVKQYITL